MFAYLETNSIKQFFSGVPREAPGTPEKTKKYQPGRAEGAVGLFVDFLLLFGNNSNAEVGKLLSVNVCRCVRHRLACILYLREGDNITERRSLEHLHNKPVKANAHAAVRRSAVSECIFF